MFRLFHQIRKRIANKRDTPMNTSSDHRTPSASRPCGKHWDELTATLAAKSTDEFATWLSQELEILVSELDTFVTPNSLRKSLRR